nr:immunoglobulin heavy chain junction region [Mus musculus]MBK4187709.1 immunoglobulin heavy chain junction region [Mus musculus]
CARDYYGSSNFDFW